ncbi:LacI family DNA-binding transcriptional regulator [Bifidobacterium sp. ESL0800]|uniref:LacI family DNA-binding transcriptional regulator n=1 Tax=Bifidobacterium sp. ESL0800 TaxID=2983236 RepID=UPI0023F850D1|nr:LacI family DNA-binding transcriptional regulator [Bifidobacterium sp. ESL0800]WEV75892.1 LacI family DNA-binding transcriptional regulator [Bifidobacterium sp. ESL0800]
MVKDDSMYDLQLLGEIMALRKGKRPASIVDVAKIAGVSHQTVSRVLNNPSSVRETTLQSVRDAIRITGYQRNENARMLRSSKPDTIGILVPSSSKTGPIQVLWSLERAASINDYSIKVAMQENSMKESSVRAINKLLSFDVAAIIVVAEQSWQEPMVRTISDLPIISAGGSFTNLPDVSYVDMDQRQGVSLLMSHLVDQGCRSIDFVNGPEGWYSTVKRFEGWSTFRHDGQAVTGHLYQGDWSAQSGYQAGISIARNLPDGVIAANDEMAYGVIRAFRDRGIRVPDDVKVCGYDDLPVDSFVTPSLTSIQQGFDEMAALSLDVAIKKIKDPDMDPVRRGIAPKLCIRESSTSLGHR